MSELGTISLGELLSCPPEYGANASAVSPNGIDPRYLRITDIDNSGRLLFDDIKCIPRYIAAQYLLSENDIVIARTGNTVGKSYLHRQSSGTLAFAGYLVRFRLDEQKADPHFVFQYLHSPTYWQWIGNTLRTGAQPNVNAAEYKQLSLPAFTLPQQRKIARILTTVDNLIEKTEALIAKYQAIKQGMMHDLFTRGVDEHGQLRPPFEEAPELYKESELGWIPKEWEVRAVGDVVSSWAVGPRFSGELYESEGNVATLRTTDMDEEGNLNLKAMPLARLNLAGFASHFLLEGDLVISRSGTCGIAAMFHGFDKPVLPGAFLIRFRFASFVRTDFLRRYFNAPIGREKLLLQAEGGVQKNIRGTSILRIKIALPPIGEQLRASQIIDSCESVIRTEASILTMLVFTKNGLMQDLLTGKVRVKVDEVEEVASV